MYKLKTKFISKEKDFTAAQLLSLMIKQANWLTDDYLPVYLEPFLTSESVRLVINDPCMVYDIFEKKKNYSKGEI